MMYSIGILERDDVIAPGRCSTSSTRAASVVLLPEPTEPVDKHQAVVVLGEELELGRQAQLVHRLHRAVDDTESEVVAEALPNDAGAEAARTCWRRQNPRLRAPP